MEIIKTLNIGIRKYDEIRKEKYKHTSNVRQYFYVSDAGKCMRKLYFDFDEKVEAKPLSEELLAKFNYGNEAHERIVGYLRLGGIKVEDEISLPSNEPNIHGRCDGILTEPDTNKRLIVEIKTINLRDVKQPMKEHILQLQLYLHYLKIDDGILLYESKHTNNFFVFDIKYDLVMVNEILNYFKTMSIHIKNKDKPEVPNDYVVSKYPCNFCEYKGLCY